MMQLMTEPKLEHRNHHLETHQANQQHYHLIGTTTTNQDPLNVSAALTFASSNNNHFHHQQPHVVIQQVDNLVQEQQQQQQLGTGHHLIDLQHPQVTSDLACQQQQQHATRQLATSTTLANSIIINNNNSDTTFHLASGQLLPPTSTTMNIQPTSYTKNHIINNNGSNMHLSSADELSIKKRREDLSRRPSYRKIFNDLTGVGPLEPPPPTLVVGQLAPPSAQSRQSPHSTVVVTSTAPAPQTNSSPSPQALDLLNSAAVSGGLQEPIATSQSPVSVVDLQTNTTTQLAQQQLQQQHSNHHQQPHQPQQAPQHLHLPANHLHQHQQHQHQRHHHLNHHHHALQPPTQQQAPQQQQQPQQIHQTPQLHHIQQATTTTTTTAASNNTAAAVGDANSPPTANTGVPVYEEVTKKRELRLQKNREAAKECRRKKKEYIKCLENRVALLENQNKALIDELKSLKDLYCKSTTE